MSGVCAIAGVLWGDLKRRPGTALATVAAMSAGVAVFVAIYLAGEIFRYRAVVNQIIYVRHFYGAYQLRLQLVPMFSDIERDAFVGYAIGQREDEKPQNEPQEAAIGHGAEGEQGPGPVAEEVDTPGRGKQREESSKQDNGRATQRHAHLPSIADFSDDLVQPLVIHAFECIHGSISLGDARNVLITILHRVLRNSREFLSTVTPHGLRTRGTNGWTVLSPGRGHSEWK